MVKLDVASETPTVPSRKPLVDWLTVAAIAAVAISLNVAFHEGVHALTCLAVGSHLQEYSALYVSCDTSTVLQGKLVAGSAPFYNVVFGLMLWLIVRNPRQRRPETQFFLWLFMLMNLLYGAGYWMFSGIADVGDMAVVIHGWNPSWIFRVLMTTLGSMAFMLFVWASLKEFGKSVGGEAAEQIGRANKLSVLSYFTSLAVVVAAGVFCPTGILSLPVTAGIFAVLGGLSPLLWMMQWFRAKHFVKQPKEPLEIHRRWSWIVAGLTVSLVYVLGLGRTLRF